MASSLTVQRPAGRVIVTGGGGRVIVPSRPSLRVAAGKQGPAGAAGAAGSNDLSTHFGTLDTDAVTIDGGLL